MQIQSAVAPQSPIFLTPPPPQGEPARPALSLDQGPSDVGRRRSLDGRWDAYQQLLWENKKVGDLTDAEIATLDARDAQIGVNKSSRQNMTARDAVRLKNVDGSGEISKMLSLRPDLRSEDLYVEDAMGNRSLRPSLADPKRLAVLAARPDLRPLELDQVRDPKVLTTLSKRPDLRPKELDEMKENFYARLKPYFPPNVAGALAMQCSDESMELMAMRGPDTRPDNLMRFYDTIQGAVGPMGAQQTPFLYLKGVRLMKERPDLGPDGLTALTSTIGQVGRGAHPAAIGGAIDRSFTALQNPNIELGQVIGAAQAVSVLPEPGQRMEALSQILLGLEPGETDRPVKKGDAAPAPASAQAEKKGEEAPRAA